MYVCVCVCVCVSVCVRVYVCVKQHGYRVHVDANVLMKLNCVCL